MIDSIEDNTENFADPQEEQIPQTSIKVVVNIIPPEPEIHEQNMTTNGYDYKHILIDVETIVDNNMNDATNPDKLTMQH